MFKDLVLKNRSYRRFYESEAVALDTLRDLVELARLSPNGSNRQSLKFYLSAGEKNEEIFSCLGWAGHLKDWPGPEKGERPAAYILILNDKNIANNMDSNVGIAATSILLGAVENGLGGCMLGNVDRKKLTGLLSFPDHLEISLAVALGKPKEVVVLEEVKADGDVKYWRDADKVHHVPKRKLEDLIVE